MERKSFFRGLGVGIIVTAIIMGIMASRNKAMTDQEIIARAKELGMVENTVLSEMNEEKPAQEQERADLLEDVTKTISGKDAEAEPMEEAPVREIDPDGEEEKAEKDEDAGPEDTQTEDGNQEETGAADDSVTEDENAEAAETEEDQEEDDPVEEEEDSGNVRGTAASSAVRSITINSGDGSHTVARKLAEAGIVMSADTFDEFLCQNGYDKKLRTGTFSIPVDASDEQIARIVTGAE